jgi:hypothetical protein
MTEDFTQYDTPGAAVLRAVEGIGGPKRVGTTLRPDWSNRPDTAAEWIRHCCLELRWKLGLGQLVWIFHQACLAGAHTGFKAFAHLCGYEAIPIAVDVQLGEALLRAEAAKREATQAAQDLELITSNPRLLATMRAANVKVD